MGVHVDMSRRTLQVSVCLFVYCVSVPVSVCFSVSFSVSVAVHGCPCFFVCIFVFVPVFMLRSVSVTEKA